MVATLVPQEVGARKVKTLNIFCTLKTSGNVYVTLTKPQSLADIISGLPRGNVTIEASPLKCSSSGKFCQFPFILNGDVKWDCVRNSTYQNGVFNVKQSRNIQNFNESDLNSFVPCQNCPKCVQKETYFSYGSDLKNSNKDHFYIGLDIPEECALLCQLAKGCNFYAFKNNGYCFLRYGIGLVQMDANITSGSKFCPG